MYKIIDCGGYFTIINTSGSYRHHTHLNYVRKNKWKVYDTCKMLTRLVKRGQVPKSDYLKECAVRLTTNKVYKLRLINIIENKKTIKTVYKLKI